MNVICPYCQKRTVLLNGQELYPHRRDLVKKLFWVCEPCGASVGCHPGTKRPLGRLANAMLRKAKMEAHGIFDKFWKYGRLTRAEAYRWLAKELDLTRETCHIGMFDEAMCKKVVEVCKARTNGV